MAQRLDESAPAQTTAREQIRQFAPRLIVLALMCVLVQGLMGLSYMGAFGKPEAKKAPPRARTMKPGWLACRASTCKRKKG